MEFHDSPRLAVHLSSRRGRRFCLQGGAVFSALQPQDGDVQVEHPNAFNDTGLLDKRAGSPSTALSVVSNAFVVHGSCSAMYRSPVPISGSFPRTRQTPLSKFTDLAGGGSTHEMPRHYSLLSASKADDADNAVFATEERPLRMALRTLICKQTV